MNKFQEVRDFFRQFDPGDIITRGMLMTGVNLSEKELDYYRCHFQRAGYLYDGPEARNKGVYLLARAIPQNLTFSQLTELAYPDRKIRKQERRTALFQEFEASEALALLTGLRRGTRSKFFQYIWRYIKANQLQSNDNPRLIYCDDKLSEVMDGRYKVHMFDMAKIVSKHFKK